MSRNKQFSKFQKEKIQEYLKKYGMCITKEHKDDIQVINPKDVLMITRFSNTPITYYTMKHLLYTKDELLKLTSGDSIKMKLVRWLLNEELICSEVYNGNGNPWRQKDKLYMS